MRVQKKLVSCLLLASASVTAEAPVDVEAFKKKLMEETEVVARMGLDGPAREYKGDGDPNTLELVFLEKRSDGPSRVSDDGEVIFLFEASDKKQSDLIGQAFERRIALRLDAN